MAEEIDPLRKIINEVVDARIEARLKGGPPAGEEVPAKINVAETLPHYIFSENLPAKELTDSDTIGKVFALIYHNRLPQEKFVLNDVVKYLENIYAYGSSSQKLRDVLDELIKLRVLEQWKTGSHVSYSVRQDFHGRVTLKEKKHGQQTTQS